jgi:SAM-dependent methyltransferase
MGRAVVRRSQSGCLHHRADAIAARRMQAHARHPLMVVDADSATYREQAAAEARFWAQPHGFGLEATEDVFAPGPIERHTNTRYTGDPSVEWSQAVCRFGRFRRGLMLGVGSPRAEMQILETNPELHLTVVDISAESVERRLAQLAARFTGRVDGRAADLNFLELAPESYDLIVSCGTVHHVTNLEYLAATLNQALASDGRLCLQDYVGEPRFAFRDEKKRLYEIVHDRDIARMSRRRPGVLWRDGSDLSPFCGVRSDEILPVLGRFLREIEVHTADALTIPMMRSAPADGASFPPLTGWNLWRARVRKRLIPILGPMRPMQGLLENSPMLAELLLVGDVAVDAGLILPGTAFAVYGRR